MEYRAFVVSELNDGAFSGELKTLNQENLPAGEVTIKVAYSSLNYKDALSFSGNKGVTRNFPHTPGIDAVGEVIHCEDASFVVGDKVLVIGYDLGMNTPGGFGEIIRVPQKWVMKLPADMSEKHSMAWGTAGFTAALCINKLIHNGLLAESGPVLVSGASGGVGSIAIMLLSKLGFEVHALTRKADQAEFFKDLGANKVVALDEFLDQGKRPLLKPVYSAAVDVAGGEVLATMLKAIQYGGSIACCGLVDSTSLNTTVLPFILRGANLLGVDSVELPLADKQEVWGKMASSWSLPGLLAQCQVIKPEQLSDSLKTILDGKVKGRFILEQNK